MKEVGLDLKDEGIEDENTQNQPSENEPTTIKVDGIDYSVEDIQELQAKGENLLKGFHEKTQSLAEEKRGFAEEREKFLKEKESSQSELTDGRIAMKKDEEFFRTHPVEEWDGYESEFDKAAGTKPVIEKPTEISKEVFEAIQEMKSDIKGVKENLAEKDKKSAEKNMDDTLKFMATTIEKDFPLASKVSVKREIQLFYGLNQKFPSTEEVHGMIKANQGDFMDRKKLLDNGNVKLEKKTLPDEGGGIPKVLKENPPDLMDLDATQKVGDAYMKQKALERG